MLNNKAVLFYFLIAVFCLQSAVVANGQMLALADGMVGGSERPDAQTLMQYPELFLQTYVRIPSISGNEKPAGYFLAETLGALGLHVELLGDRDSNYNVAASLYPLSTGKPNLILLNHIDVVSTGPLADWTHPPFSGVIADGYVWGRGAFDNKGSAIMQAVALARYAQAHNNTELPFNITLLAVSGEENDSYYGANYITDHYLEHLNPMLVLGEGPAGMRNLLENDSDRLIFPIAIANKREMWITLRLAIDSHGHGSIRPERYAIQEMIQALQRLNQHQSRFQINPVNRKTYRQYGKLEGGLRGVVMKNLRLFKPFAAPALRAEPAIEAMFTNSITITELITGAGYSQNAHNVIPQVVEAYLDCRLLPGVSDRQFLRKLKRVLNNPAIEIDVVKASPEVEPTMHDEFFEMVESALLTIYPDAGVLPILSPSGSDCNYFRYHNIPVISFIPAGVEPKILESIHANNERFPVDALEPGIAAYQAFFDLLMQSNQDTKRRFFFRSAESRSEEVGG